MLLSPNVRAAFARYGLPLPEQTSREEAKKLIGVGGALINVFFEKARWVTNMGRRLLTRADEGGWDEEGMREIGKIIYDHITSETDDLDEQQTRLIRVWAVFDHFSPQPDALWETVATSAVSSYVLMCGRWCKSAFSRVIVEPKFAASLMATSISPSVKDDILPPWRAFLIAIPESFLPFVTKHESKERVHRIFVESCVQDGQRHWAYQLHAGKWELAGFGAATEDLVERDPDATFSRIEQALTADANEPEMNDPTYARSFNGGWGPGEIRSLYERNARVLVCAQRLIAGVCLAMSDPSNVLPVKPSGKAAASIKKRPALRGAPLIKNFVLGRHVTIDCRETITNFVEGASDKVRTVRELVRGHWKPHLSARCGYPVHVEPYFRGAEEDPVLVRPHVLHGPKE